MTEPVFGRKGGGRGCNDKKKSFESLNIQKTDTETDFLFFFSKFLFLQAFSSFGKFFGWARIFSRGGEALISSATAGVKLQGA